MKRIYTEHEIRVIAQSAIGKTFGELKDSNAASIESTKEINSEKEVDKAFFGHLFEKDVYGMDINSFSRPDFEEAGIELKVTPYKRNKNKTVSAKERLVLNIIDYMSEYKNDFENSHFLFKNNKLQIIWYLYEKGKKKEDLKITHELLYEFPNEDMPIIKKDWEYIVSKIKDGKAEELSEADTMYLGACTKGANKESKREQPFSSVKAMQRAFCFKTSYMTSLVRKYIGNEETEKLLDNTDMSFMEYISSVTDKYKGKTKNELKKMLNVESKAKNVFSILVNKIFNVKSNLKDLDEFQKANIIPKTIRVEKNGKIKESMSFPYFKFDEIVKTSFEDSEIKETLEITKYLFFIFRKTNNDYVFEGVKLWNMPEKTIEKDVREMYEKTRNVIASGNIVKSIDNKGRRKTNFPSKKDSKVCHVRPHGRNAQDTCKLPVKDKYTGLTSYTKQCFWFNNTYIRDIINEK